MVEVLSEVNIDVIAFKKIRIKFYLLLFVCLLYPDYYQVLALTMSSGLAG